MGNTDASRNGLGQAAELDRIEAAYPDLIDNDFVAEHRDDWLAD